MDKPANDLLAGHVSNDNAVDFCSKPEKFIYNEESENVVKTEKFMGALMNNNTDYSTLEKRVGRLETDVDAIKISMAALNARSESFATKADLEGVKSSIEGVKASIERDISGIYREIAVQARWLIAAIVAINGVAIGITKLIH